MTEKTRAKHELPSPTLHISLAGRFHFASSWLVILQAGGNDRIQQDRLSTPSTV